MDELAHEQKNTMGILMTGQNNIDLTVTGQSGLGRYIYAPFFTIFYRVGNQHKILHFLVTIVTCLK